MQMRETLTSSIVHYQGDHANRLASRNVTASGLFPRRYSPQGRLLFALQRAVGNRGVARWMTERRHDRAAQVNAVLRSPGRLINEPLRQEMQARLDSDFSGVRVHTDSAAQESATAVGARAYTSGSHIVIGPGGLDKNTLAHELTHVLQQRHGPVTGTDHGDGLALSDPGDRYERDARHNAACALARPVPEDGTQEPARPVAGRTALQAGTAVQRSIGFELETRDIRVKRSPFSDNKTDKRDLVLEGTGWKLEADDTVGPDQPDTPEQLAPGLNGEFILGGPTGRGFETTAAGLHQLKESIIDLVEQTRTKIPTGGAYSVIHNNGKIADCVDDAAFRDAQQPWNEAGQATYWRVRRASPDPMFAVQVTAGIRPSALAAMFSDPEPYASIVEAAAGQQLMAVSPDDIRNAVSPYVPSGTNLDGLATDPALVSVLSMLKTYTHRVSESMQNIKEALPILGKTSFIGMLSLVDDNNLELLRQVPLNVPPPATVPDGLRGWKAQAARKQNREQRKRTDNNLWFLLCHALVRNESLANFPHKYRFSWDLWVLNLFPTMGEPRDLLQEADSHYDQSFGALKTRTESVDDNGTQGAIVEFRRPATPAAQLSQLLDRIPKLASAITAANRSDQ